MIKELFTFSVKTVVFFAIAWGGFVVVTTNGFVPNLPPSWKQAMDQAQGIADKAGAITGNIKGVAQALSAPFTLANTVAAKAPTPSTIPIPIPIPIPGGGGGGPRFPDPGLQAIGHVFGR